MPVKRPPGFELVLRVSQGIFDALCAQAPAADGTRVIGSVRISGGEKYRRPCPGRKGKPCVGDGWQELELRNMTASSVDEYAVSLRDQPCCRACRR